MYRNKWTSRARLFIKSKNNGLFEKYFKRVRKNIKRLKYKSYSLKNISIS